MSNYHPSKRAHRILRHLAMGPAPFRAIFDLFAVEGRSRVLRKLPNIMDALQRDGLVDRFSTEYHLTPEGREALATLERGDAVCTDQPAPTVRIFAKAAASDPATPERRVA